MIRDRSIAALVAGQFVSSLGSQMTWLALPWFVLVTTGSASRMGVVFAVEVLPIALFGVVSGGVVQRYGARSTMLVADLVAAPLIALVPLLQALGKLSFGLLLVIVFAIGSFSTPYFSSTRLILPEIVGEDERTVAQANSVMEATTQLSGFAGPALAGVLIGVMGATNVLWLDAGSYLVSFLLLALFVQRRAAAPPVEDAERGVLAGIRFILRDRLLRVILGVSSVFGVFIPFLFAALPVLAYERYGGHAEIAGWLFAAWGGGSVAGSVVAYRAAGRIAPLSLAAIASVGCVLPLWALVFSMPAVFVVLAIALSSFFVPAINAPVLGLFTLRSPPALRGKVMTGLVTANGLARPLSYAVSGWLLHLAGITGVFLVVAVGMTMAVTVFVFTLTRPAARMS